MKAFGGLKYSKCIKNLKSGHAHKRMAQELVLIIMSQMVQNIPANCPCNQYRVVVLLLQEQLSSSP
jgi:hypothetical protein